MESLFDFLPQASFSAEGGNICLKMIMYVSVDCVNFLRQLEPECEKWNFEYDLVGSESHFCFPATVPLFQGQFAPSLDEFDLPKSLETSGHPCNKRKCWVRLAVRKGKRQDSGSGEANDD